MSLLSKVFGDPTKGEVRRHRSTVEEVDAYEATMQKLDDQALKEKTSEFRRRLDVVGTDISFGQMYVGGLLDDDEVTEARRQEEHAEREVRQKLLDDILPEAFAVVREVSKRVLGMRHFDEQIIGGIVLHKGRIAEMRTGEGKTLVATLALYLNALEGKGAHLVTVNDYLARRDAGWNGPLYHALGMSTGVIAQDMSFIYDPDFLDEMHPDPRLQHLRPCTRREAYAADITYATNNELGFDYLRDNMATTLEGCVQRQLHYAIVDEVDSILIDEARTPLIISGEGNEPTEKYYTYARLIPRLSSETDFTIDEKTKSAALTDEGIVKIEQWTGIKNIYDIEHAIEAHQVNQALRAHALWQRDRDYIVRDGEVIIVDEFTGRAMPGRRWSDGLHQAIEAKEGVKVQQENVTLATITFQNFFRLYKKLAGMTGTALTEAEEFHKIYALEVVPIPTHRPMVRMDQPDLIYRTADAKWKATVEDIAERYEKGQPVLVGTTSIDKSEILASLLSKRGIPHNVLNAKLHEREASVISEAGKGRGVTIATNMAGRGTDIVLGESVSDVGGLYVIGTERHESRRIDNQLRGRSGRQGDPGETRFYLSFEDDLMRVFGGERMQGLMERFRIEDDVPLESRIVSRQIESAQSRVEGHNFDSRRNVVEYDDVMNKQREVVYGERRKILEGTDTRTNLMAMTERLLADEVPQFCEGRHKETWDLPGLWEKLSHFAPLPDGATVNLESLGDSVEDVIDTLMQEFTALYEEREREYGPEILRQFEQRAMLQTIDESWVAYLTHMEHLREGINLQGYAQLDPLIEYKKEAFGAFQELLVNIQRNIVRLLFHTKLNLVRANPEAPAPAVSGATAPPSPRADRAGSDMSPEVAPAARPAAAAASAALARATGRTVSPVRNVVEQLGDSKRSAANSAAVSKVGRNDPCPCGSGLKYKRCHGANA